MPRHCVYISKGSFEGNPVDFKALFIDAKQLAKMEGEKSQRYTRETKVICFIILSMSYLAWTCSFCGFVLCVVFSEKNPQRRRLVERYHRYVLKDGKTAADIYPPKGAKEVKPAVKSVEEEKPVEEVKAAEEVKPVEEVKVEEKPAEEVKVVEEVKPVVEEEKPVEEEKAAPESTSVWTSISNTFWWLLGYKN